MSIRQNKNTNSIIENNITQNILQKLKNQKYFNYSTSRKILQQNDKGVIIPQNNTIYYSSKGNFPSITIISSNKIDSKEISNKSLLNTSFRNRFSTSNLNRPKRTLIALKSYGSTKDLLSHERRNNNFIFISSFQDSSYPKIQYKIKTEKKINNVNKNIEKIDYNKKSTTILYRRRNDTEQKILSSRYTLNNTYKNGFNKANNTNNNQINNYRIKLNTYKNLNSKTTDIKKINISHINTIDYNNDIKTYNNKGNLCAYVVTKNEEKKLKKNNDNFTFNPRKEISIDNSYLTYKRFENNGNIDKKYKILSIQNNSSMRKNLFFNPIKYNKNKDISIYSNYIKKSKEKIKIDNNINQNIIRNTDINNDIKIIKDFKKNNDKNKNINKNISINNAYINHKSKTDNK